MKFQNNYNLNIPMNLSNLYTYRNEILTIFSEQFNAMHTNHTVLRNLFCTFLLLSNLTFSQNIDSTFQTISGMKKDTNRVNFVNEIIWNVKYQNPQRCIPVMETNVQLAKSLKFNKGIANGLKLLGILMDETGQISRAISCYQQAVTYYKKERDTIGMARVNANIGILYRDQRRFTEAIDQFNRCFPIFKRANFLMGMYQVKLNLSICYLLSGDSEKAMWAIQEAEKYMRQMNLEEPNYYGNLANIYMHNKQFAQAEKYFKKAISMSPDGHGVETWIDNLAMTLVDQHKFQEAIPLFNQSIATSKNIYNANTMATHWHLANAYIATQRYEAATKTLKQYIAIRDSVFSKDNAALLSDLSKKYDTEKKLLQIKSLQAQKKIQNEKIASEKRQKIVYAGGMIAFLFLGIFLYRLVQQKKKANAIILEQKQVVEQQKESLEVKNQEILDSITYAKRLQNAILPAKEYWRKELPESFILYKPKDIVAGDFYWLEKREVPINGNLEELIFFAAADCTGHGVPGAMVSVICCNALNRAVLEFQLIEPGEILDTTRQLVVDTFKRSTENVKDGMDISLGCFHVKSRKLTWAGANNPLWLILGNSHEITEWKPDKEPIGTYSKETPFNTHEIILPESSKIYLFTDGFADQFGGENGKKFKYKQFKESILAICNQSMQAQQEHLDVLFEHWKGNLEQVDDVCVIGIKL